MSSKASGGKAIAIIRYLVGYVERYIKNVISQFNWTLKQSKWAHREYVRLHTQYAGSTPDQTIKILIGVVIALAALIVFKVLLILMFIKSI